MNAEIFEGVVLYSKKHSESHGGGLPATLHQEFWLGFSDGTERRYHILNCDLGLRKTNRVVLIFIDSLLVAIINRTANEWVVFPPPPRRQRILPYFIPALLGVPTAIAYVNFSSTPSMLVASILCVVFPILGTWRLCVPDENVHKRLLEQRLQIVKQELSNYSGRAPMWHKLSVQEALRDKAAQRR